MEYSEVVRCRRMVRAYDPDRPVPPEVVTRLLEYAVRAPSAGFSQGWGFLVLTEPADRAAFWAATTPQGARHSTGPARAPTEPVRQSTEDELPDTAWSRGMRQAPLIVVPHASRDVYLDRYAEPDKGWTDRDEARWPVPYWYIDAGFASLLILLGVVDEGLGGCFFGIPPERQAAYRAAFEVPESYTPIGAMTIGYPAPDRRSPSLARGRRPVSQVAHVGRWGRGYPNGS